MSNIHFVGRLPVMVVATQFCQDLLQQYFQEPLQSAYCQDQSIETAVVKVYCSRISSLDEGWAALHCVTWPLGGIWLHLSSAPCHIGCTYMKGFYGGGLRFWVPLSSIPMWKSLLHIRHCACLAAIMHEQLISACHDWNPDLWYTSRDWLSWNYC